MAEKEIGKKELKKQAEDSKLEPCDKPHTMETSRPTDKEEACDEGVQ
ncbi:MAG: hypothetical protein RBT73_09610 [Spirochaetia bacterium]|jgi:hypothetical protein|nr:hypothetical protein [Spirochaetia bacterium]